MHFSKSSPDGAIGEQARCGGDNKIFNGKGEDAIDLEVNAS